MRVSRAGRGGRARLVGPTVGTWLGWPGGPAGLAGLVFLLPRRGARVAVLVEEDRDGLAIALFFQLAEVAVQELLLGERRQPFPGAFGVHSFLILVHGGRGVGVEGRGLRQPLLFRRGGRRRD